MNYFIVWEINIDAESPEAAARQALAIQRDPDSIATVFSVIGEDGEPHHIDLAELDQSAEGGG